MPLTAQDREAFNRDVESALAESPRSRFRADMEQALDLTAPQDAERRQRIDELAKSTQAGGDLDRGNMASIASGIVRPEERLYFLRRLIEQAETDPIHRNRGYLSRLGRAVSRGFVGTKENFDDVLHELFVGDSGERRDQRAFAQAVRSFREMSDPLVPTDMNLLGRFALQAGEMAVPMAVGQGIGAPLRAMGLAGQVARRATDTGYWTTQILPGELQNMRDAGIQEDYAMPAAAVSSVMQAAVETLNLSPLAPKGLIGPIAQRSLSKALKEYGTELSEETIQAAISEATLQVMTHLDEQAPGRGLGESFRNVVGQTVEAAGPLAVLMAPGQAASAARTRWAKSRLLTPDGVSWFVATDPDAAEAFAASESPSRKVVEDLIDKQIVQDEHWTAEERKQVADLIRQAKAQETQESPEEAQAQPEGVEGVIEGLQAELDALKGQARELGLNPDEIPVGELRQRVEQAQAQKPAPGRTEPTPEATQQPETPTDTPQLPQEAQNEPEGATAVEEATPEQQETSSPRPALEEIPVPRSQRSEAYSEQDDKRLAYLRQRRTELYNRMEARGIEIDQREDVRQEIRQATKGIQGKGARKQREQIEREIVQRYRENDAAYIKARKAWDEASAAAVEYQEGAYARLQQTQAAAEAEYEKQVGAYKDQLREYTWWELEQSVPRLEAQRSQAEAKSSSRGNTEDDADRLAEATARLEAVRSVLDEKVGQLNERFGPMTRGAVMGEKLPESYEPGKGVQPIGPATPKPIPGRKVPDREQFALQERAKREGPAELAAEPQATFGNDPALDGIAKFKEFVRLVPEFKFDPHFTVVDGGRLQFKDGGTYTFSPPAIGVKLPENIQVGERVHVDPQAVKSLKKAEGMVFMARRLEPDEASKPAKQVRPPRKPVGKASRGGGAAMTMPPDDNAEALRSDAERAAALESMKPIVVDTSAFGQEREPGGLRKIGESLYRKLAGTRVINRRDGRQIRFGMEQFKKPRSHSADPRIMRIIPGLKELLGEAVPLWSEPEKDALKHRNIAAWHTYGARAILDGQPVWVRLTTFEMSDGREVFSLHHDHNVTWEERIKKGPLAGPDPVTNREVSQEDLSKDRLYTWYRRVKGQDEEKPRSGSGGGGSAAFRAAAGTQGGFAKDFDQGATGVGAEVPGTQAGQATEQPQRIQGMPMPELVKLAKAIQGKPPLVRRLGRALGLFRHDGTGSEILIDPRIATDPKILAQVLAHEMGHLIDYLPDRTLRRGNILGRIASLKGHMKGFLEGYPGGPGPLTEADKRRLQREAQRLSRTDAEVEVDEVIRKETPVTPQDILNIWNSLEADINPELLDYIKRLSSAEKKSIVKDALNKVVPERLKRFAKVVEEKTGRKVKRKLAPDARTVRSKYRDLLEEEIRKRQLLEAQTVREELIALSAWWTPYDRTANRGEGAMYRRYRESSRELYAQALSVLLVAPKDLQQRAPQFWRGFWAYADRKPAILQAYLGIQDSLFGLPEELQAIRRGDLREGFARGEEAARARRGELEARQRSVVTDVMMGLFDKAAPVLADAKRSGSAEAEAARLALDELTHRDSPIKAMLETFQREIVEPLTGKGLLLDDLGEYLFHTRITRGGREGLANPLGHTPETSAEALADMKRRFGDQTFALLEEKMSLFRDQVFSVVENAVTHGVYNRDTFDKVLEPNKDSFAAFAVVDYITDTMPAGIRQQVGTFKEVGNPFSFTAAKMVSLHRAIALNQAKTAVRDMYLADFPGTLTKKRHEPGKDPRPPKHGNDHLVVMENGQPVFYETEKYIAGIFEHPDIRGLTRIIKAAGSAAYKIYHPLFVTYSPGWQVMNIWRDFKRTYKNLAAIERKTESTAGAAVRDVGRLLAEYKRALGPAWRRGGGQFDPLIREMEENKALAPALAAFDWHDDSTAYERMLSRYGVMGLDENGKAEAGRLKRGLSSLLGFVERVGVATETVSKVAAWNIAAANGIDPRRRAYYVRNYAGTPNYKAKGTATTVTNSLFMYSNVILQGWRADARVATDPKTAGGYWLRSMLIDFMPKMAMIAAASGAMGATVAAWMALIPDYDKSKYIVIPLGTTTDEKTGEVKARYARIPHDDVNRFIAASLWELAKAKNASISRTVSELWGEVPSASPLLSTGFNWIQFARGQNPKDWFRDRDIIGRDAFEAGGWYATRDMLRWTLNQFGVASTLNRWWIGEPGRLAEETVRERIVGSVPGLDRIIKTSNRGMYEDAWNDVDLKDAEAARLRLKLDDVTRNLVKERYRLNRMGEDRLSEGDARRRAIVNTFYKDYLDLTLTIKEAETAGNRDLAEETRGELKARAENTSRFLREQPEQAAELADRIRAVEALEDLTASRPVKAADVPAWERRREAARSRIDRLGLDADQVRSIWAARNRERIKTAAGRRDAMKRLNRALSYEP